ncbi:unnamed protein product [Mytilus coruscus]|uniref:Uncharacterized protein n=1 Tax=Mytilus coruscus TaxID=42192 RepID=A0A6J8DM22_MYTCO|nr:unnamed protein product [Mytilus coruscus]
MGKVFDSTNTSGTSCTIIDDKHETGEPGYELLTIPTTPTITVEDHCLDDKFKSRPESRNSISSTKSDISFLRISRNSKSKDGRPKSADIFRVKSVTHADSGSSLRRTSSDCFVNSHASADDQCTCLPREERKCELSGNQLVSFYGLWKKDSQRTLGKKLEVPRFMKRSNSYRQCGCKTREYEKQKSNLKTTCPTHGI